MWKLLKERNSVVSIYFSRICTNKQAIRVLSSGSRDVNDTKHLKPWTEIPGPKSYPFVGPLFSFLPGGEFHNLDGIKLMQLLYSKYGPFVRLDKLFHRRPILFLFDAESSAQVLRSENETPIRPSAFSLRHYRKNKENHSPGSSTGLITEDGELWQKFRSTVNPVLMPPKTIRLHTSDIDTIALEMVERLKSHRDDMFMIPDLDKEINLWSLESLGVIALGCRLKCFDNKFGKDALVTELTEVVTNIMKVIEDLDRTSPTLWQYYPTAIYKKAMKYYEKQETLAKQFIDQAIKEMQINPKPDDQKGVLEKLIEINKEVALTMASDMLLAGVDTVANTVLGALYLLASNPKKQSKLRVELKTDGDKKAYLRACVKESMRIMPVASGNTRETTKEYNILGYNIPKGVQIAILHGNMSLMDKYFVRPHEYIPERWLVDKDDPLCYKSGHPFAYNPFGFGSRTCIGRRIAELEIETFIARVIEHLEITCIGPPPKVVQTTINYVRGPYNFVFKDVTK